MADNLQPKAFAPPHLPDTVEEPQREDLPPLNLRDTDGMEERYEAYRREQGLQPVEEPAGNKAPSETPPKPKDARDTAPADKKPEAPKPAPETVTEVPEQKSAEQVAEGQAASETPAAPVLKYKNQAEAEAAYKEAERAMHAATSEKSQAQQQLAMMQRQYQEALAHNQAWQAYFQSQAAQASQQQQPAQPTQEELAQLLMSDPAAYTAKIMEMVQQAPVQAQQQARQEMQQFAAMQRRQAEMQQFQTQTGKTMEDHFNAKHADLAAYKDLVEAKSWQVLNELVSRFQTGRLTPDDQQILNDLQYNPTAVVDRMVEMAMPAIQRIQTAANPPKEVKEVMNAATTTTPSSAKPQVQPEHGQTPEEWLTERQAQQERMFTGGLFR